MVVLDSTSAGAGAVVIDSHQHFWQLNNPVEQAWLHQPAMAAICRDFLPGDLQPLLAAAGVHQTVLVQTQHNLAENRWALRLADENPFIAGVVGWVDLQSPQCEEQLLELKEHPKFVGVRHIVQDEADDDFIVQPQSIRGLQLLQQHGVPYDLLFYPKHLRHAVTLARLLPELPMVIDHLAKPPISTGATAGWEEDLRAASQAPNIFCKLSGMVTEANWENWQADDLRPYTDIALDCFGPARCMAGSDWPVCELAGSYQQVHDALSQNLAGLSESELAAVRGGTAASFYRLNRNNPAHQTSTR